MCTKITKVSSIEATHLLFPQNSGHGMGASSPNSVS